MYVPKVLFLALAVVCAGLLARADTPVSAVEDSREFHPIRSELTAETPGTVCRVIMSGGLCSGTVVACDGKDSLILSCNHCFSEDHIGRTCDNPTAYPQTVRVEQLSTGKAWTGKAVVGSKEYDMGFAVIPAVLPVAKIDRARPKAGAAIEHWGISSGYAAGVVIDIPPGFGSAPTQQFRSRIKSIPGDSGAGVFAGGKLVATNWGYWTSNKDQGGTPVEYADKLLASQPKLVAQFGRLGAYELPPGNPPNPANPPANPVTPGNGTTINITGGNVLIQINGDTPKIVYPPVK